MKKKIGICTILIIILTIFSCGTNTGSDDTPEYDDTIILYEKWPFPVGVAVPGSRTVNTSNDNALNPSNRQNSLLKHFNVVVAENEMKPENIMPDNKGGPYKWEAADALVKYAEENGKRIRGHTLFWEDQTKDWFFSVNNAEELYAHIDAHAEAVFKKYGGKIEWWDVCNEVIDQSEDGPRRGRYYNIMQKAGKTGMDRYEYVLKAFQSARKHANENGGTNVQLFLTDFGVERPFKKVNNTKQQDFYDLVKWLVEKGAPIDGVGFQGHFRLYDHPVDKNKCLTCSDKLKCEHDISSGIDKFSEIGGKKLKIHVCEMDISIFSNHKGENNSSKISSGVLNERLTDLAQTYRDFFDMFEEKYKAGKLDMVLIWGIADGHSWLNSHPVKGRTDYPLLFNRNYKGKEAYWKLVN